MGLVLSSLILDPRRARRGAREGALATLHLATPPATGMLPPRRTGCAMIAPIRAAHAPRSSAYEPFLSVVGALLRGSGYVVQVVHAFFDESGSHSDSAVLCVAGYAFEKREHDYWRKIGPPS